MSKPGRQALALSVICVLSVALLSFGGDAGPRVILPQDLVALESDDTLEFTLHVPRDIKQQISGEQPSVGVWLVAPDAAVPDAAAPKVARAWLWPSPRPAEWLVHVRGLKAPQTKQARWDLLVRWNFPEGSASKGGELRLKECIGFKAEATDVVLLMDGSLSMQLSDKDRLRVDAARYFIEMARLSGTIGRIAIAQFDSKSRTIVGLTPLTENFEQALASIDERGQTDIDGGLRHALTILKQSGAAGEGNAIGGSIVLLTDGKQEPGIYANAHEQARAAGVAVHTLALGRDADRTLLKKISGETGGTFSDAAKDRDLSRAFAAIAGKIARLRPVLQAPIAPGPAAAGAKHLADVTTPFPIDGACRALAIDINAERPGMLLIGGAGGNWQSALQVAPQYFAERPGAGDWTATWRAGLEPKDAAASGTLTVAARTALYPLFFRPDPQPDLPLVIDTDDPLIALTLAEGDAVHGGTVTGELMLEGTPARIAVEFHDDGAHGDGAANDGIFGAMVTPPADGVFAVDAKGTLKVVVNGTREGAAFRRETESAVLFKRHGEPALLAGGGIDFGACYPGQTLAGEIALRVRGPGGLLRAQVLPPADARLTTLSECVVLPVELGALKPRQSRAVKWNVILPEMTEPGEYGGVLEFALQDGPRARVPWRAKVLQPQFAAAPAALDFGTLLPGDTVRARLKMQTQGGVFSIYSVELVDPAGVIAAPLSLVRPKLPLRLNAEPSELELEFRLALDAAGGPLERELVWRDMAHRERGRMRISAIVAPRYLELRAPLDFGPIETGDDAVRPLIWRWNAAAAPRDAAANVAIIPAAQFDAMLAQAALTADFNQPVAGAKLELAPAALDAGAAVSRLTLTVPPDAPTGQIGGTVRLESGPVMVTRQWTATVVRPQLAVEPAALDFGTILPGQSRTKRIVLRATGAKPFDVAAEIAQLAKPRLAHITLPVEIAQFTPNAVQLLPDGSAELALELAIPDLAQDGLYRSSVQIRSRLGAVTLPASVTVINDVAPAPFHVSPSSLLFNIENESKPPTMSVRIISHRDEDVALNLKLLARPKPGETELPLFGTAAFLLQDGAGGARVGELSLVLPARAAVAVTLQANPRAEAGALSSLIIEGGGEQQAVEIQIQRSSMVSQPVIVNEPPALLSWLILLFILILALLGALARRLIKRNFVRYAVYAVMLHLAFVPLMMPGEQLMEALPSSVQLSLLESQEDMGYELSDSQLRRLEALRVDPTDSAFKLASTESLMGKAAGPDKLPGMAEGKRETVLAEARLDAAKGLGDGAKFATPDGERKAAQAQPDAPLQSDAPLAEQKPAAQPATETTRAPAAALLRNDFDAPLSATPEPARKTEGLAASELPASARPQETARPAPPQPEAPRPLGERAIAGDAPLVTDALAPVAAPAAKPALATEEDFAPVARSASSGTATALVAPNATVPDISVRTGDGPQAAPVQSAATIGKSDVASMSPNMTVKAGAPATGPAREIGVSDGAPDAALDAGSLSGVATAAVNTSNTVARTGTGSAFETRGPATAQGGTALVSGNGINGTAEIANGIGSALASGGGKQGASAATNLPGGTTRLGTEHGLGVAAVETGGGRSPGGLGGGTARVPGGLGGGDAPLDAGTLGGGTAVAANSGTGGKGTNPNGQGADAGNGGTARTGSGLTGGDGKATAAAVAGLLGKGLTGSIGTSGDGIGHGLGNGLRPGNGPTGTDVPAIGAAAFGGGAGKFDGPGGAGPGQRFPGNGGGGAGDAPLDAGQLAGIPGGTGQGGKTAAGGPGGGGGERTTAAQINGNGGGPGVGVGAGVGLTGLTANLSGTASGKDVRKSERSGNKPVEAVIPSGNLTALKEELGKTARPGDQRLNLIKTPSTGTSLRVNIGLSRHAGDWNSSPTALHHLRAALLERAGLPDMEAHVNTIELSNTKDLLRHRMVLVTSNQPIMFTPAELAAMRKYLEAGGTLWVNDSSASESNEFDIGFRAALQQMLPTAQLLPIPMEHPFYSACYDLKKGYKGFKIPPGDKYRQDYNEAVFLPAPKERDDLTKLRAAIIYTRNDYADGMEIDPRMNAGMVSLTDLTNAEMLEGSLRFGLNIIAYSMGAEGLKVPDAAEGVAEAEKTYRYKGPALPVFDDFTATLDGFNKALWYAEKDWCNLTELHVVNDAEEKTQTLVAKFTGGTKFKAAITRNAPVDLSNSQALIFDLRSSLKQGCNVALLFNCKDGASYETRPVFVRPGWNRGLRFPLGMGDMKSSVSKVPWKEYDTLFDKRSEVERLTILIYNLGDTGAVKIGPISTQPLDK